MNRSIRREGRFGSISKCTLQHRGKHTMVTMAQKINKKRRFRGMSFELFAEKNEGARFAMCRCRCLCLSLIETTPSRSLPELLEADSLLAIGVQPVHHRRNAPRDLRVVVQRASTDFLDKLRGVCSMRHCSDRSTPIAPAEAAVAALRSVEATVCR